MIEMVNGYPCADCTDVSNAKRGLDPENPTRDPVKQEQLDRKAGRVPEPAVVYEGRLADMIRAGEAVLPAPAGSAAYPPAARLFDITV
ncbi:hypothetical protein [Phreatobacter cathodiphilus]|uniref:Uncharacterized protein n=1 Tax=Phreatobacter cathodiphilus TaxID=1868589 RepID=A0A2S0NB68_9HYPH|nr:hypothetical protein [Phreatobacter cathodiphilus]AVO45409.1 hypothetical protein C6569_10240 [Phreatobacter cathodiphilus]